MRSYELEINFDEVYEKTKIPGSLKKTELEIIKNTLEDQLREIKARIAGFDRVTPK
jgi:hypothetical protein